MKTSVGIILRDNELQMAELSVEGGKYRVLSCRSEPVDETNLQTGFQALAAKGGVKSKRAVLGIGGSAAFVRTLQLLATKKDKMEQAIRFELQQQTPFDLADVEWDWSPMGHMAHTATQHQVLVAAVKRNLLEGPVAAARAAGWRVEGVTLSSVALYNCAAMGKRLLGEGRVQLLIDIGRESSDLVLVRLDKEPVLWVRSLPIGFGDGQADAAELVEEIKRAVDVYRFQAAVSPDEVLLSGRGVSLEFLRDHLSAALQLAVHRLDPMESFEHGGVTLETPEAYTIACGLAWQSLDTPPLSINLLRRSREATVGRQERLRAVTVVSLAAWLLVLSTIVTSHRMIRERQTQLEQMDRLVDMYRTLGPKLKRVEGQLAVLDDRLGMLQGLVARRSTVLDLLAEVENGMEPQTWLEQVVVNNPLGRTAAGEATLTGKAPDYQAVNTFLSRLKASPAFQDVKPVASSVELTADGRGEVVVFTVSVRVVGSAESS